MHCENENERRSANVRIQFKKGPHLQNDNERTYIRLYGTVLYVVRTELRIRIS
jgi:hypothetical protein